VDLELAVQHVPALEAAGPVLDVGEQLRDLLGGDEAADDQMALGSIVHVLVDRD